MPLDKGKLQKLYSTLQQGGYSQSYDEFEKGFTGNDNYPNRKKVYDLLTEHGADIGNSYEDFMKKMQTPAAPSPAPSYSQQRTQAPSPKPQPKPAPKPKPRPKPKAKGGGMTAAQRAAFIKSAQDIVHHSAAGLQRVRNQMDYANGNRGLQVRPVHLGQNSKVVRRHANGTVAKPRPVFDVAPEQQPGDTYLTESGNEYGNRAEADTEQNAVDQYRYDQSETGQLNNAYAEADRLDKLLEQRGKELDAENQDKWWRDLPRGGGGAVSTMNANDNNGRMNDTEYLNLLAARKKVDEQIRDLKAARDEKTGTFLGGLWRGFRDYAFDPSNWDNGYRDLLTTSAMLRAKTGAAQTKREKASERMMMEDTYKAGVAAQKAEEALGNGYRWARITAQALPYGLQFMAGNAIGVTGGLARAGEGMGVKLARKIAIKEGANNMIRNFGRSVLKNTGVMLGDLGAAAALSTTVQAAQTGADIGKRYAGDVVYDPKTDDYKLEGGKSLGRSIYEGVANSTIENYTEMLGEHMHLGKFANSALSKVGLGKVSNWFTKVGKTDFMQGVNKYMKMAGFNGYPQEVMEEEVGIPLHAVFDGGNKMSDLLDGRQQLDIVGGMLFSMAGMGGASMAMQGGHKAAMAVQYHQDQHKLDNADKIASFRLTSDKWAPIKEEIDGTTNEDFGKTMKNVLSNDELSDQEKQAVWDYAQRLIIMRGHNMGQEAATRNGMTDKETNTANESYTQGYNTTDPAAMNDAKNRLAAAQQKLDGIFGENTNAQQILDAKKEDGSPYFTANDRKAAQAVVNAQQEYEGMMQRVRDDIDDEVQQTGAIYDSRTNDQGVIQSATLKAQNPDGTDKKVYITSGNVVMTDDGKSVDKQKSDMSIVVVDEDGKVQMISPDELFSLDTPIDGAQAKQQAIDAIQQSKAQEAADKINGKVNLTAGNTYTLTDNTGQQIEATIVADGQTGAVQNPDGTVNVSMNGKVVPMDVNTLQQMVDNTNMQKAEQGLDPRLVSRGTEQGAEDSEGQEQPTEQEGDQGILDQGGTVVPDEEGTVPTYPGSVVAPDMSEPHQWQVDDTFTIDNGGMPVRGQVTGVGEDGVEIYTESPVNGKKMQVVSPEELQSMTTEVNGETVQTPQDEAAAEQQPTEPSPTEQNTGNGTDGVNESNGVNGEQAQEQAPQTQEQAPQTQAQPQQTEGQQPQRAIDRIPSQQVDDGKGNVRTVHNWEQAEPGDTYDALTEIYHGNAERVKKGIDNRVGKIDKAIKGVQKKMDAIDNSDDFDEVAAQSEQYDQLQQQKDELEKQKKYWQGVQMVPRNRKMDADRRTAEEAAAAKSAQEKAEAEAAEKARQEREQVNGVPDVVNDIPADARKRGFRNVNGMVVNRQGETQGVTGRESNVKFSSTDTAKGHIKVIDADELQPSHVSGQRNPSFFIDEAQPKDRTDTVSGMAAAKIAADLNPEEITGDGSAYQFSAPTVNSRGEVIQGNNRSDALKLMYSTPAFKPAQDAYKQYIADHAEEFGFTPEDVAKIQQMEHPVMVNELDVPDDEAIRLGQMRASDNESGGIERIDPVTTSQKLGGKVSSFANVLLSSPDEDASLSDVLMQNGAKAVKWLRTQGAISDTAAQSAFDKKGNFTPEARMDLQNILKQSLFQGGVSDLPTMFDKMPAKAQKAILSTFMRDFDSAESERILPEIQRAIEAWYDCAMSNEAFAKASNYKAAKAAMHDWTLQTNLLDDNMPSDKFSNFAMELACRLQGCSMREAQQSLNDFFDLVQGKSQGDLFGGTTMGEQADRQESIRRIFNIEYKPISNNNGKTRSNAVADNSSQSGEGRQGSPTDGKGRERAESGSGPADGAGGTEKHDDEGIDKSAAAMQQPTQPSEDSSHSIGATSSSEKVETERQGVNTEPSEKQKEAGNYKKGHIKVDGYDISIENPKGSTRSGKDASGKAWSVPMHYDYGYIKGTEGVDGDHIDVYLSDNPTSGNVYVVDQIDQKTGKFDEHKVMYGFPSMEAAREAYASQYEKGWKIGKITEVSREDFKKWVDSSVRKTKPFADYKSMKDAAKQQRTEPSEKQKPRENNYANWPIRALHSELNSTVSLRAEALGKLHALHARLENEGYFREYAKEEHELEKEIADYDKDIAEISKYLPKKDQDSQADDVPLLPNGEVDWDTLFGFPGPDSEQQRTETSGKQKTEEKPKRTKTKKEKPKKANAGQFGLVSDERMEELKKRLRAKLNNLNMGVDPEVLAIGLELTAGYIDRGVKKFADYSKAMINDLGDVVRPYLKAFYNGVRDMPEITSNGLDAEMDDYETVSKFNVATIGKEGEETHPSVLDTAEQVSNESHVERQAEKQMEMHQVDVMGLMADLSRGRTTSLNEHFTDNDADADIKAAHDNMMKQLDGLYRKDGRKAIEGIINTRDHVIDFYKGKLDKGETQGEAYGSHFHVDYARSLARAIGERKAAQEFMDNGFKVGAAAQQRPTEPSNDSSDIGGKKEQTRYSERGFTLRPATEEDVDSNKAIYVNGKRTHIVMVVRKGEQVGAAQFSKPVIEAVYTTDNERVPLSKIEVEDIPTTVHLKTAGDFYEAYGNDAVALGEVTGVSVVTRKDGTRMAGFPKKMLDEYEQGLRNNGWDVSVDGKATKKATEKILQQLQSAPKAKTSTNAIKNALRGKKTSAKENNEKKKAVSSQQELSLFDDLFGGEEAAAQQQPTEQNGKPRLVSRGTERDATEQTSGQGTTEQQKPAVITTDDEKGKEKPVETKPAEELTGDSKEYQERAKAEQEFVERIKGMITDAAKSGESLTMSDIKKAYKDELDGNWELKDDYSDTDLQELVERAMTLATREVAIGAISKNTSEAVREGYDKVVKLYEAQPSLNARDSTRVAHQQYSTPTPFGYLMDWFLRNGKNPYKGLEPSAGNGALTIGFPAVLWHVNDIDERRLMNLRTMPYGKITNQDGTMPFEPKAYNMVATNPPFGSTQEKEFDGGRTKISSKEGLMAINALASMKDDGRAAIIIGGNTSYMSNGAMQAKDMKLFKHLYTHYNVVDVINLDGDMYKRNGTGYNERMILIAGRKTDVGDNPEKFTFPPVKKKARAEQVKTFDELYKRVEDDIQRAKQMERESPVAVNSDGSHTVNSASERTGNSETAGGVQQQPVRAGEVERRPQPGRTVRPSSAQDGRGNGERGQHGSTDRLDHADQRNAGSNHAVSGNGSAQGQSSERREGGSTGRRAVGGTERGRTAQRDNANGERLEVTGNSATVQQRPTEPSAPREKVELGQEKVAYPNKSQSMTLQSRVPAAQAEAIAENLDKLGDVDEMVRSELGYSSKDELYSHLAAEQIDSVALAINQMKHGKGFIIGDMTGVGKGRQGAALIRWAIRQGCTPIYFTQKPTLFTDNYRDMCDIGSKGLHPFLIASKDDGNIVENVLDENGQKTYDKNGDPITRVVYGLPKPKERERVYNYILQNGKLPPEYDYVLVTYSQIQSGTKTYEIGKNGEIEVKDKKYKGKKPTGADTNGDVRRDVLEKLAKDNYVFLDESHTVGGQSSSGLYMQDMLKGAEGVTYLSATFAKRPDNMPLYAMKTAMSESGLSQKDMIDAIQKGGVTLQEIMSKQLVQSGQMIRRERDFTGVSIDWEGVDEETDKQQRAQFDEVAKIFNAIREFQDNYVDPSIEKMSEDMAEEGKFSEKTRGTSHMGVNNVPFASKMYNLVNQLLFSLKANAVADKAIECLKKGEKPVISFNNTMEGFLDDMPRNTPMPELPNFSLTLMRALEGTLRYTEGEIGNKDNQVNKTLNLSDLSDEAVAEYNKIRKTILNLSIGLPIDPMDAIKMRIEAAGYKVGEITGRKSEMVKDTEGNYIVQSRSSKEMDGKAAASAFNSASGKNGGLDVLLINKSGSTGISLHASSKFSDQSPRVMIAAQFQSDINDEVQMRGRIDRTGQVHRGRYIYLVSSIPAEQRLQMMFKNKLKSLDANTTSSQKSKFNEMEVTDFMNKYGDEVTWSYMMEHPDLEERLGDPLDMLSDESKKDNRRDGDEENNKNSGCAGKILRRLPFLSVKEQEQIFNDLAEAYKVKMQILNDAGENDLEITTMPLRAETKSRKVWKEGSDPGSDNAFADNTYLETAEVDVLKKPMKAKEVREYADRLTDGKPWEQWHQEQHEAVEQFYEDKKKAVADKAKVDAQKRIDKAREDYIKGCLKARKKGDNKWSDEEISHMADIAAKEAADKEQTKINNRTVSIDAQRNDVLGALDAFTPLEPLIIPLNLKDTSTTVIPSLGTFLGIKFGKGYSRSSSTAVFATLDGRRKIEVPLSDKTSLENIQHQSVMLGYQARGLNMDNWDSKVPTKSRKTAYIVTGNLMQALVDTQKSPETKGQLISYTTIDGDVKQGILMNDRFKEEDLKTSVPISSMLQKIIDGDTVESADKEVKIERGMSYHYNDFKLSVPKSKSRGGKYFLDKKLLRLLEDEFTTSGSNMTAWVSQQNLKKVLDYLSKALGVTVQVKASLKNTLEREGDGAYSDEELSLINDPVAKWLGKSNRTKAQQKAFANRERKSMESAAKELADRLHLDNVNIVMDASTLEGRKARAKGFYDRNTDEITIVIPNHRDVEDVMQTLLHEGVAHYGLRKMFGSHFDTFLDNVYAAADNDVRRRITDLALRKYGGDFRVATEEYLASLAEQTDFERMPETFWQKIKRMFLAMLHDIGFENFADTHAFTLSDNELRYILWRSYENLKEPGRYRSILGEAEDVAKQAELKVGNYGEAAAQQRQTERLTQKEREQKPNTAAMYGSARNSDYAAANDGVREPEAWGKRDMLSKAEQVSHGIDPDLLFRDTIEDDDNTARETYNRMADEAKSRIREAWQDSMINVRNLQQAVLEQRGEKLEDYEDAYNAENRSHGKSRAESEYFTDNLYKPLLKAVDDVAKAAKVSVGDVTEYMMAKHGLERNIVFARRDADAAYKKAYDEAKGKYDALMNASRAESDPKKADALEKAANKVKFPDYDDIFNYLRMRDYAGLTSLTGQSDVQDAEAEAQRIVNDMESKALAAAQQRPTVPSNLIDELWKATNAATKWTLKKGYESGIISKDNYNYVSGMFNYYVPLRGWQEDTAGDLFDYVGSGDKGTAFSPTLHKAKGRRSEADNPIAYIGNMAVSAIVQGNKNKVKQTFLGFVENHPTNLVTVSEMWYRNFGTDTDPDWREDVPNIPEDATADEVADIVQQHEDMMEQLKDLGKATKQRGRLHLGVPVKRGQALEHHVEVMVNGKKYVLYINGNPRAAQALNGTRQRRASERSFESSKIAQMGRLLAERYTSLSPSFTVSNALRDLTMAAITTLIKESPAYAMRFRLNVLKLGGPARMFTLMKWYKKAAAQQQPTGQMSETQKYFYEFMTEGAETGFTSLKEIDEYKKDMDKMYRNMNQKLLNPKRLFRGLSQGLEYANRCIEDMTRFAIYMASRQSGRNVKRSVNDAKNITLNFNRKGSGEMGNSTYRNLQIFVNPAIQSLQNVGKMAKDHPVRFSLLTGSIALIGAAQVFATQLLWSVFGGGDGDDDDWNAVDEYWKLPSWQRRNNLVMWIPGTKKFAMIPLAQEFRVFHGFGETMTTVMEGKSGENPALEVLTQASDLLPLDFAGNNGNPLVNLAPTVTQPLLQVGFNTDFTGRPLYKDNDFNKYEPSFQKAYVGTPSWLIKSSEFINDITGGDDHMQGWWERTKVGKELNNPAVVDHILKGYYGGMYSFLAQLGGTMYTLGTGNMPDAQEVPVVNRVITAPRETEQGGKQKLPDWYYDLSEENARQQNEFSGYKKDYMKGDADGKKKFNELINSKDFQKWQKVNTYIGAVQQIRTAMNYTKDPNEKAELEKSLAEVLGELKKMKDE